MQITKGFYFSFFIVVSFFQVAKAQSHENNESYFFDFEHIKSSIAYLESPSLLRLMTVADTQAMKHLKNHSDRTGYYSKESSTKDIAKDLLVNKSYSKEVLSQVSSLFQVIKKDKKKQDFCTKQVVQYLPNDFTFKGHLYFTWGYDIGVSMDENASINLAHKTFRKSINEVWYYCIHELHHVGFQQYNPFPDISKVQTKKQLFTLVQYLTFLEGTAVYAAYHARKQNQHLEDPDYIALENPNTIQQMTTEYFEIYRFIKKQADEQGNKALTSNDWNLINNLSDGKRLWYRVGGMMAQKLDKQLGREKYKALIKQPPQRFFNAYDEL
ncbi:MAG: hypothetical protein OQK03_10595 [Colwellia sp.]|nr:hypothetical protein [Colwellia sp.]